MHTMHFAASSASELAGGLPAPLYMRNCVRLYVNSVATLEVIFISLLANAFVFCVYRRIRFTYRFPCAVQAESLGYRARPLKDCPA